MRVISSLLASLFLLSIPSWSLDPAHYISNFIGRFHPLLVHFPIVGVLATVALEWINRKNKLPSSWINIAYWTTLISILTSVVAGALLMHTGDYGGAVIRKHQWLAIGLGIYWVWATKLRTQSNAAQWQRSRLSLLAVCLVLTISSGHLGGSLTHGNVFLQVPLQKRKAQKLLSQTDAAVHPASLQVFGQIILPILSEKCNKCHNSSNPKGGLDMQRYSSLIRGGKSKAPIVVAGAPQRSELSIRVHLPTNHEEFMPPDGRTPLTTAERRIIDWWIEQGASPQDTLGTGPTDSLTLKAMDAQLERIMERQMMTSLNRKEIRSMAPKMAKLGQDLGLKIEPDAVADSLLYRISMQIPTKVVTDDQIARLMPHRHLFSKVSLVSADITDAAFFHLSQMPFLEELMVAKCCIDGSGLKHFIGHPRLRVLNLSHTDVSDVHALTLTRMEALERVFLFNAFVSKTTISALDQHLQAVDVLNIEGPFF